MLKATVHGPITRIHLAQTWFGRPLYSVDAYLVDGLLVDTGCPATAREMVAWCREQPIDQVVNTHHHEDHSGADRALRQVLGLKAAVPPLAVPILAHFPGLQPYRRIVWGQPGNVQVQPLGDAVETAHYRFQVISTPGHCPDHACFFEPKQGWLFSGDLYIHERVRYLRSDEKVWELVASLRRVLALRPRVIVCAHAGLVEDACAAIECKIDYWESLADRARALARQGLAVPQISAQLLGREGLIMRASLGHFSKANLIRGLLEEPAS